MQRNGETVQFPAGLLLKFVTEAGVDGHFVLLCKHLGVDDPFRQLRQHPIVPEIVEVAG